jgi:AcrR family transcriptional regulator
MAKAPSPPSQRRVEGQDSRELILAVALELFTKRGYDGTSIDDIRQAAGFRSKASLYTHFKSKEDVSEALTTRILGQMEKAILAAHRSAPDEPMAQFLAGVSTYIEWSLSHRQEYAFRFIRAQQERMLTGQYDYQEKRPSPIYPMMLKIIRQLRQTYPVRQIEDAALFSMLMGVISRAVIDQDSFGDIDVKDQAAQLLEVCLGIMFSQPVSISRQQVQ